IAEVLYLQIELAAGVERGLRDKTDDLASCDRRPVARGLAFDHLERAEDRRLLVIRKIHRDLRLTAALEFDSEPLDVEQSDVPPADRPGDLPGYGQIFRRQIDVESDERQPRAHGHRAGCRVNAPWAEIGFAVRVALDRNAKGLEFVPADVRQINPVTTRR